MKTLPAKVDKPDRPSRPIDTARALELRLKNRMTYQEIADMFDVSKQAVQKALSGVIRAIDDPALNQAFENSKAEILTGTERVLLKELVDPDRLKKATTGNIAYSLDKVFQMNRLVQGKSTQNVTHLHAVVRELQREEQIIDVDSNEQEEC